MISVAFFNNKGGVGKTTLAYHIAHMLRRLGHRVLAVDLDPQANLTAAFLDEGELEHLWRVEEDLLGSRQLSLVLRSDDSRTISDAVRPILRGTGDITYIDPTETADSIWLLPGELELSTFEDKLSEAWPRCFTGDEAAIRTTTAFYRLIDHSATKVGADIVLIDVGPNLGAINRSALLTADAVVTPLAADLFSLLGLHNLGPTLREWRRIWQTLVLPHVPPTLKAPPGRMTPLGYVIMQPSVRLDRPVHAYKRWLSRIPQVYKNAVLDDPPDQKSYEIATIRSFRSLMPLAHDARKPMFDLRPADGAIGSTQRYVQTCFQEFRTLTENLIARTNELIQP
ncbi:ParA family protein [Thermomonospora cellulosilytica]|uniref:Cellulose biosynthesis protein BcsQ n=1 Tax=Thermomonospora cellulosilytica TaxID=1411118 RepID=A0A7W3MZY4_9ACTN|nr:AAA family ATPase [Thermomonospora cellulosilytica]MBA9004991.1 cellulose biosynthesis protein BcsQ [Thermomonospora cellulosilytica]